MENFIKTLIKIRDEYPPEERWRVVPEDTKNGIVTSNGSTYAVHEDGNITSLCVKKNGQERGSVVLKRAIKEGGTKLQAFGKKLFKFYTKNGFRPISWVKFDPALSPEGWIPKYNEEPLIFYAYDETLQNQPEQSFISFMYMTKPCKCATEAYSLRDEWIKTRKEK